MTSILRGDGVKKSPILRVSIVQYYNFGRRGRGVTKNSETFRTSYVYSPFLRLLRDHPEFKSKEQNGDRVTKPNKPSP